MAGNDEAVVERGSNDSRLTHSPPTAETVDSERSHSSCRCAVKRVTGAGGGSPPVSGCQWEPASPHDSVVSQPLRPPSPAADAALFLCSPPPPSSRSREEPHSVDVITTTPPSSPHHHPIATHCDDACLTVEALIIGYEIIERRTRFTVFKICMKTAVDGRQWFIFRRYTDFCRLHEMLRWSFPEVSFSLPPKRWFGGNFDPLFLRDRQRRLQQFLDIIVSRDTILLGGPVQQFFCLDEPPGPYDTLPESRALCESLEEEMVALKRTLVDREERLASLQEEVCLQRSQISSLRRSLSVDESVSEWKLSAGPSVAGGQSRPESGIVLSDGPSDHLPGTNSDQMCPLSSEVSSEVSPDVSPEVSPEVSPLGSKASCYRQDGDVLPVSTSRVHQSA